MKSVLVCLSVGRMPEPRVASRKRSCDMCGSAIWVVRSSPPGTQRWCERCARELVEPDTVVTLSAKQRAEVADWIRRNRANREPS
jgi:hypothetical protein